MFNYKGLIGILLTFGVLSSIIFRTMIFVVVLHIMGTSGNAPQGTMILIVFIGLYWIIYNTFKDIKFSLKEDKKDV